MDNATAQEIVSGAPGTITIGETTYLVAQATKRDMMTIKGHIDKLLLSPINSIKNDIKDWPPEYAKIAIDAAVKVQLGITRKQETEDDKAENYTRLLFTPEGVQFMAFVLLRKNHPNITLEYLKSVINDDNAPSIGAQLVDESKLDKLGESLGRSGSPAQKGQ